MRTSLSRLSLALALALSFSGSLSTAAMAAETNTTSTAAAAQVAQNGIYRYRLGDFQITALSDGTVPLDLHALLRGESPARIDAQLHDAFESNPHEASINAFLIDTGTRRILVDTGAGGFFGPGNAGQMLANLKAAGYRPEQIDDVLLTHLHSDHAGGLLHDGRVVFPHALIHVGKADLDFFLAKANQNGVAGYDQSYFQQATAIITPYRRSGQLRPFVGETQILPGIQAIPAPGHTPGQAMYRVQSRNQSITFISDIVHVSAVQFAQPAVTITFDVDQALARIERSSSFAALSGERELVAAPHLSFPGIGHIARDGGAYRFVPVDYVNRDVK